MTPTGNIKKKLKLFGRRSLAFLLIPALIFPSFSFKNAPNKGLKIVVIDAGHGGKDPGCNGDKCFEKNVTLAVALRLGKLIEANMPDVKVIYTRKTDVFVELEERAQIANRNNADLFISIHCNAASTMMTVTDKSGKKRKKEVHNPKPYGSETYVMGIKNEAGNVNVAKRENSAMLLEDNYKQRYNGFDPNSAESYIVMSNYTSAYVIQSASIAMKIQEEYVKKAGRVDKGVRRESFWVLWRTAMPSILTELGFLTNPLEEKFLGSEKGQQYMATAIYKALRRYKDETEGKKKVYDDEIENIEALENENLVAQKDSSANSPEPIEPKDTTQLSAVATPAPTPVTKKDTAKPALTVSSPTKTVTASAPTPTPATKPPVENGSEAPPSAALSTVGAGTHKDPVPSPSSTLAPTPTPTTAANTTAPTPTPAQNVEFRVQFLSSDKELPMSHAKLKGVETVKMYKAANLFKYTSGAYPTPEEATAQQSKLKGMGFTDCFVVAFKNGGRIDMAEARRLIGKN